MMTREELLEEVKSLRRAVGQDARKKNVARKRMTEMQKSLEWSKKRRGIDYAVLHSINPNIVAEAYNKVHSKGIKTKDTKKLK